MAGPLALARLWWPVDPARWAGLCKLLGPWPGKPTEGIIAVAGMRLQIAEARGVLPPVALKTADGRVEAIR